MKYLQHVMFPAPTEVHFKTHRQESDSRGIGVRLALQRKTAASPFFYFLALYDTLMSIIIPRTTSPVLPN